METFGNRYANISVRAVDEGELLLGPLKLKQLGRKGWVNFFLMRARLYLAH
jgi:hypothetical protein